VAACRVVYEYVVEKAHSQQRTRTQHDMLPQHPVNIKELFCECF